MNAFPSKTALCLVVCIAPLLALSSDSADARLSLITPTPGAIVNTNSVLIEADVHVPGDTVRFVDFQANYFTAGFEEDAEETHFQYRSQRLARDSVPPYRTIWDITNIQDHSHGRMTLLCWAVTRGDTLVKDKTKDFVIDRNPHIATDTRIEARHSREPPATLDSNAPTALLRSNDNLVRFQCYWNRDSFYCVVDVKDKVVFSAEAEPDTGRPRWWMGDDVELFIDPHNTKSPFHRGRTFQVLSHPEGASYSLRMGGSPGEAAHWAATQTSVGDSGYTIRCAMPWDSLGLQPRGGHVIGFDVTNFDRDRSGGLVAIGTWAGLNLGNHHNASEWGHVVLRGPRWPAVAGGVVLVGLCGVIIVGLGRRKRPEEAEQKQEKQRAPSPEEPTEPTLSPVTRAVLEVLEEEYTNEQCNLEFIAEKIRRYPKYVSSLFRKEMGIRFTEYLNNKRLSQALELLKTTDQPISTVCLDVGYSHYGYFTRLFRKRYGMTPSEARKNPPEGPVEEE